MNLTPQSLNPITWPGIIVLNDSSELIYLEVKEDWLEYICLNQHISDPLDYLVDSQGRVFSIAQPTNTFSMQSSANMPSQTVIQLPHLEATQTKMTALMLIPLVRKYAVYLDLCCSAKIVFNTPAQGIEAVALLDQSV
jgi:hypothetical protein